MVTSNLLLDMHELGDAARVEDKVILVPTASGASRTTGRGLSE